MHTLPFSPILTATTPIKHLGSINQQPVPTLTTPTTADSFEKQPTISDFVYRKPHNAVRIGDTSPNLILSSGEVILLSIILARLAWCALVPDKQQEIREKQLNQKLETLQTNQKILLEKIETFPTSENKQNATNAIKPTPNQRSGSPDPFSVGALVGFFAPKALDFITKKLFSHVEMDPTGKTALGLAQTAFNLA